MHSLSCARREREPVFVRPGIAAAASAAIEQHFERARCVGIMAAGIGSSNSVALLRKDCIQTEGRGTRKHRAENTGKDGRTRGSHRVLQCERKDILGPYAIARPRAVDD